MQVGIARRDLIALTSVIEYPLRMVSLLIPLILVSAWCAAIGPAAATFADPWWRRSNMSKILRCAACIWFPPPPYRKDSARRRPAGSPADYGGSSAPPGGRSQHYEGSLEVIGQIDRRKRWTSIGWLVRNSKGMLRFRLPAEVKVSLFADLNHPDRASDQWIWRPRSGREQRIALQDRSPASSAPTSASKILKSATWINTNSSWPARKTRLENSGYP